MTELSSMLLHSILRHHIIRSHMPKTRTQNPWLFSESDHYKIPWFLQVFQVGGLPPKSKLHFPIDDPSPPVGANHVSGVKLRPQEAHLIIDDSSK